MALPTIDCFLGIPPEERVLAIYEALLEVVDNTGGSSSSSTYTSNFENASSDGSIPAGVYGWSITVLSGTATINGGAVPVGARVGGGGYGGRKSTAAISYTITGGNLLVAYDN